MWGAFGAFVVVLLLVDLVAFGRHGEKVPLTRAAAWSIGWTLLGVAFGGFLWLWQGGGIAGEYLAGFVIEKSLSVDNLFVFALIFAYFGVPAAYQRRAIFWGIVGAILLRALSILAGAALLDAFHYAAYLFGGFLVLTGIRMARHRQAEVHPERNPLLRLLGRVLPLTSSYHGDRLTVYDQGRRMATPMFAALASVATFDVVFAVDSIPAIFAVTRETFLVYAANAFSLLGLSALYFVLAGMIGRFRYLNLGLAAVLVFVGAKMVLADVYAVPVYDSLAVIAVLLTVALAVSAAPRWSGEPIGLAQSRWHARSESRRKEIRMRNVALDRAKRFEDDHKPSFECSACGYGVARSIPPERCPMCQQEGTWIHTAWRRSASTWAG
jgi:tellurite resistance protein TerC